MIDSTPARSAALIAMSLLLTSCDKAGKAPAAEDQAAARANVEAMAKEHAEDVAQPSPAAEVEPERDVTGERIAYAEVENELVYGHFAYPSDMVEPLPAIIMIHEWWGLNDNVRSMAERLAAEGYIVLAVDLFGGEVATSPEAARQLMLQVVEDPQSASTNIEQAYGFVHDIAGAPSIASLGWCFGGGWSLNTAMLFPKELDAAVIYYGQVTDDEEKLRPINAPILGFFGDADRGISVDSVKGFEQSLKRLRMKHEIHVYPGAGHAFANPTGNNYKPEFAEDAWQKTLTFLQQNLAAGG
ncbi:MAG: dienelactone hydrolase family protein [Woeseiaceae bacterium]